MGKCETLGDCARAKSCVRKSTGLERGWQSLRWAAEEEAKEEPCARSELNKTPEQNQRKEKEDQQRSLRCGL